MALSVNSPGSVCTTHHGHVHMANFTRCGMLPVACVHTTSTALGSSGTLRPHQEVFSVDANGTRRVTRTVRVGLALQC